MGRPRTLAQREARVKVRHAVLASACMLAAFGTSQVASAAWIHAKAYVAQRLLERAWVQVRGTGGSQVPWPWADLHPVARLAVPARSAAVLVLDDANLRALAFGPAHLGGTAEPGADGNSVIVAHRDTHFAFLRDVAAGDEIDLELPRGVRVRYRVRETAVVDKSDPRVTQPGDAARLTLVTCWPFEALRPGTPLRYVVVADRVA